MRQWLTKPNHSQSHDDPFPGGHLYARQQDPDPKDPPTPPPADDNHDDDDIEPDGPIDKPRWLKTQKRLRDMDRKFNALMATTSKVQKENEALKKAEDDRKKAAMGDLERANAEKAELAKSLADEKIATARALRKVELATHLIDPEYLDAVDGMLAGAMAAEGFKVDEWFKALRTKKPALFTGSAPTPPPSTPGGGSPPLASNQTKQEQLATIESEIAKRRGRMMVGDDLVAMTQLTRAAQQLKKELSSGG